MAFARIAMQLGIASLCAFCALEAQAQERGQWILGSGGLGCGSQPSPGIYYSELFTFYRADTLETRKGTSASLDSPLSLVVNQATLGWVSTLRIFGGTYGFSLQPSVADGDLELNSREIHPATGFGDFIAEPISLGWSPERFDILAAMDILFPTGKYGHGPLQDTGRGQWTVMPSLGSTFHLDDEKRFFASARAVVELPVTDRRETNYRQGDFLDLEYGVGASLWDGVAQCGIAGYAGFQLSSGTLPPSDGSLVGLLTQVQGLGPEVDVHIHLRPDVVLSLSVRDYFEFAAQATTEGNALFTGATLEF